MFNLQRDGTGNGSSNVNRIFKAGLSSSYDVMAEQSKKKAPNVSDLNQNVETSYNSKLKFT